MPKKKRPAPAAGGDRRGRSRAWTIVSFEELEAWRQRHNLPKKRVADLLGVTNSTYHNWARGMSVATPATQQRIQALIRGGPEALPQARAPHDGASRDVAAVLDSTAQIVNAYLMGAKDGLTTDQLCALIREVSRALRS